LAWLDFLITLIQKNERLSTIRNLAKKSQTHFRVYNLTQSFPKEEFYGLVSQMRRSASSIPTNIAEGCGRNSSPELNRFLVIAAGSSSELQYQFILSRDLKYISDPIFKELFDEITQIRKMIYSYCEKLKAHS
jgi:four helix bundle protein